MKIQPKPGQNNANSYLVKRENRKDEFKEYRTRVKEENKNLHTQDPTTKSTIQQ